MEYNVNRFKELLLSENTKHNLISRKTNTEALEQHIEDCRKILAFMTFNKERIIDIGSGAGFPGLILAMYKPDNRVTLIEADLKKSEYLKMATEKLHLKNVNVIKKRAEEIGRENEHRASYDICCSRAVASMNIMLEYSLPLVKVGGSVLLWKGRNYEREIAEANRALQILAGKVADVYLYNLVNEKDRAIVRVEKIDITPDMYPRRVGIPVKRPL
jgi:16S rRNA (guanine527-N7)-methyltransferase